MPGVGVAYDIRQTLLHDAVDDIAQVRGNGCLLERDVEPCSCASDQRGIWSGSRVAPARPGPPIAPESSSWNIISELPQRLRGGSSTVFSASRAAAGSRSRSAEAAEACSTMTPTAWLVTSCSSRAMRSRSSRRADFDPRIELRAQLVCPGGRGAGRAVLRRPLESRKRRHREKRHVKASCPDSASPPDGRACGERSEDHPDRRAPRRTGRPRQQHDAEQVRDGGQDSRSAAPRPRPPLPRSRRAG